MSTDKSEEIAKLSAEAMWAEDNATRELGIEMISVAPGRARMAMTIRSSMTNGHGMCHGGYIFLLADSAFAFACNSHNERAVAAQGAITFLAPAQRGETLRAVAEERHRAGRSGVYDVRVTGEDGRVIAEFRGHSRTIPGSLI